jgi:hypothetical protein
LAGCCESGDEPSGSGATELVRYFSIPKDLAFNKNKHETFDEEVAKLKPYL